MRWLWLADLHWCLSSIVCHPLAMNWRTALADLKNFFFSIKVTINNPKKLRKLQIQGAARLLGVLSVSSHLQCSERHLTQCCLQSWCICTRHNRYELSRTLLLQILDVTSGWLGQHLNSNHLCLHGGQSCLVNHLRQHRCRDGGHLRGGAYRQKIM